MHVRGRGRIHMVKKVSSERTLAFRESLQRDFCFGTFGVIFLDRVLLTRIFELSMFRGIFFISGSGGIYANRVW